MQRSGANRGDATKAGRFGAAFAQSGGDLSGQSRLCADNRFTDRAQFRDQQFLFVQLEDRRSIVDVQAVVHFALAGEDGAVPSAELLEDGDAESLPEKIAVTVGERRAFEGREHDDGGFQAGQIEASAPSAVCQRKGEIEGRHQGLGGVGLKPVEIVGGEFAHILIRAERAFEQGEAHGAGEGKTERFGIDAGCLRGRRRRRQRTERALGRCFGVTDFGTIERQA